MCIFGQRSLTFEYRVDVGVGIFIQKHLRILMVKNIMLNFTNNLERGRIITKVSPDVKMSRLSTTRVVSLSSRNLVDFSDPLVDTLK